MDRYLGENTPKPGFGVLRLPKLKNELNARMAAHAALRSSSK